MNYEKISILFKIQNHLDVKYNISIKYYECKYKPNQKIK